MQPGKFNAHRYPRLADVPIIDETVGTRKIDVLKNAKGFALLLKRPLGPYAVIVDDNDFTRLNLSNVVSMDQIESTRLRGQDKRVVQFAEHQRPKPERVSHTNNFLLSHQHKRE